MRLKKFTTYSLVFVLCLLAQSVLVSYSVASTPATSAGRQHTLTIKSDGTPWAWGFNASGHPGDGSTTIQRNPPVQIGSDNTWIMVSAGGGNYSLELKWAGTPWAWAVNNYGQLGDGTTIRRNSPVRAGTKKTVG